MVRLFVGLGLPSPIKQELLGLMAGLDGVRWQQDGQLHLTLKFIGEVPEPQAKEIGAALSALSFAPFSMGLAGIDIFGSRRRPRMLWTGVRPEDTEQLQYLHGKIDRLMQRCGLKPEQRKYIPHVTLGRFKGRVGHLGAYLAHFSGYKSPIFDMDEITLFRSHLGHQGADYMVVSTYPGRLDAVTA